MSAKFFKADIMSGEIFNNGNGDYIKLKVIDTVTDPTGQIYDNKLPIFYVDYSCEICEEEDDQELISHLISNAGSVKDFVEEVLQMNSDIRSFFGNPFQKDVDVVVLVEPNDKGFFLLGFENNEEGYLSDNQGNWRLIHSRNNNSNQKATDNKGSRTWIDDLLY